MYTYSGINTRAGPTFPRSRWVGPAPFSYTWMYVYPRPDQGIIPRMYGRDIDLDTVMGITVLCYLCFSQSPPP